MKPSRRIQDILFLAATFFLLAFFYWISELPFFKVEQIRIHGMAYYSDEKIRSLLEKQKGERLFLINPIPLEQEIKATAPGIRKVKVLRWLFPARLEIYAEERAPWLYWEEAGIWIDSDGISLTDLQTEPTPKKGPYLSCPEGIKDNAGIFHLTPEIQQTVRKIAFNLPASMDQLQKVLIGKDGGIILIYGGYTFQLGNSQGLDKKIATLYSLLGISQKYEPSAVEYINITVPDKPAIKFKSVQ